MKKSLLILGIVMMGISASAQSVRTSLYEEFTGENCPPCASTNPGLNAILLSPTNASKIIAIKWQVPIPSAPSNTWSLYQTNKAEIDWRYRAPASGGYGYASQNSATAAITSQGVNSAPSGRIDGQHQWVFGAASDHPAYINNGVIATAQSYTSAFTINMQREWNYNCSAINLTVNIAATANFNAVGNLIFRTVMVEREINFATAPGTNGEKVFEDVAIKSFPTIQGGTPMAGNWTNGQTMTFTLSCPLPSYVRDKEEVAFVGFIQDDGDKKVAQAARADKAPLPPDGLATLGALVDITCSNAIKPMLNVDNTGSNAITSIDITPYVDGIAGTSINWTGNIPVGTSSLISLGSIAAPTTPGAHTFSYNVTNMSATPFNVSGNRSPVSFMVVGTPQMDPISEGFVLGAFPPAGWVNINSNGGSGWSRNTQTGAYWIPPMQSVKYDFYNNNVIGDSDDLILPAMNLEGAASPEMTFDYAYAQRTTQSNDKLDVLVSDDCGANWTNVWSKSGATLASADPTGNSYIPNSQEFWQWKTEIFSLDGFNKNSVLVKFVATSGNGNNLYLDNINLQQKNPVGIKQSVNAAYNMNVFPNPTNGLTNITINSPSSVNGKLNVYNAIGQVVFTKDASLTEGSNVISLDVADYANGIYSVVVESTNGSMTKKFTVTK